MASNLGWLDPNRYNIVNQLKAAAQINRSSSPIAGKLWSGTPISNFLAPKVSAAERQVSQQGYYQSPQVNYSSTSKTPVNAPAPRNNNVNANQPIPSMPDISTSMGQPGGDQGYDDYGAQIDASYNPAYDRLNSMEQQYRQEYPTAQKAIEQEFAEAVPEMESEQSARLAGLNKQRTAGTLEKNQQTGKARQLYNELQQGRLTRFGGSSSTGDAAQELLGRDVSEQMGDINQNFGNYNQQLAEEEKNVNDFYTKQFTNLENEKKLKLEQLKNRFDSQIREINGQRSMLDQEKAARRLAALQELSASIRQANQEAAVFERDLQLWRSYKDEVMNNAKSFNARSFTIPGFKNILGSSTVTRSAAGGGGAGGFDMSGIQGILGELGDEYELGGLNIGGSGKPSYSINKKKSDGYEDL